LASLSTGGLAACTNGDQDRFIHVKTKPAAHCTRAQVNTVQRAKNAKNAMEPSSLLCTQKAFAKHPPADHQSKHSDAAHVAISYGKRGSTPIHTIGHIVVFGQLNGVQITQDLNIAVNST